VNKSRRKHRGRSSSPFVMLHWLVLDSQGWHDLSPYARLAYIELCRRYNGANNGSIGLSVRLLGQALRCSKATAARAITELENAGFIQTMKVGTFKRKDRLASEYRLNIFRCHVTGDTPNRAWNHMRWRPDGLGCETVQSHQKDRDWVRRSPQYHSRDRQTQNGPAHGIVPETHLDSSHRHKPNKGTTTLTIGERSGTNAKD
jgi:hypothetical protein